MPAASDCELIRTGFWGQPINAATALSFVVVGALLMRSRPILGITSCAAGVGSVVFHGPMPTWAEWAHDLTVAMLLVGLLLESRPLLAGLAGVALGVGLAFFLEAAELITVILAAITAIAVARKYFADAQRTYRLAIGLLASGGLLLVLSRTGGPLCSPGSPLQGHGGWHILAAGSLLVWARATSVSAHGLN